MAAILSCPEHLLKMQASESLLQRMTALYVASHYRNTPNDLMLAADAPAHALYVLLGPVDETQNIMPDVLAVAQVALEGAISRKAAHNSLAHGNLPQVCSNGASQTRALCMGAESLSDQHPLAPRMGTDALHPHAPCLTCCNSASIRPARCQH